MSVAQPNLPGSGTTLRILRDDGVTFVGITVPSEMLWPGPVGAKLAQSPGLSTAEQARARGVALTPTRQPREPLMEGPGWAVYTFPGTVQLYVLRDDGTHLSWGAGPGVFSLPRAVAILAATIGLSVAELARLAGILGGAIGNTPTPTPTPGSNDAHLTADEKARRDATVAHFSANDWQPDLATVVWDDTITVTSSEQLYQFMNNVVTNGVTRNSARNQRVLLDTAGTYTFANRSTIERFRGYDYLAFGKILLIDGQGVLMTSQIQLNGCRGIYFRNLNMGCTNTIRGAETTWTPGFQNYTVTTPGTGYAVGDTLSIPTIPGTVFTLPDLRVASVDGNGGIVTLNVISRGIVSQNTSAIPLSNGVATNARISVTIQNPRDDVQFSIARNSTFPLAPVVILDNMSFSCATSDDPAEFMSAIKCVNAEQLWIINSRFNKVQTALNATCIRRLRRTSNDYQNMIGDSRILTKSTVGTVSVGAGQTFNQMFPDGKMYVWDRGNTYRNMLDDAARVNIAGHLMGLFLEHTDFAQLGTSTDNLSAPSSYSVLSEFNAVYGERVTFYDSTVKLVRYGGGCQAEYNDDALDPTFMEILSHSNIYVTTALQVMTSWSGLTWAPRNTIVRAGESTPNATSGGISTSYNYTPGFWARQASGYSGTTSVRVRNCILGSALNTGSTGQRAVEAFDTIGNVIADPAPGPQQYLDTFTATNFTTIGDPNGRTRYPSLDVAGDTPAQFRARLYAQFTPKGAAVGNGAVDPALWPTL